MILFDENFGAFSAPKCDIAGMLGSVVGAAITNAANASMADKANKSNEQIARETNETNLTLARETNAVNERMNEANNRLQTEMADKAYQRSTAANQIAELVKAGYSPQQAKSIVGGSASSAAMPMPSTTPAVNEAPQVAPYSVSPFQMSDMSALGDRIASDLNSENGGTIGQIMYNDVYNDINSLSDYDPAEIRSIDHFIRMANERNLDGSYVRPDWHEYVNSDKFMSLSRSRLGRKAFNADHSESISRANQLLSYHREGVAFNADSLSFYEQNLKTQDYEMVRPYLNELAIKDARTRLETWDLTPEHNKEYLFARMQNLLAEESNQALVAMSLKIKYENDYKAISTHPDMALFSSIYKMFDDCGMTKTEIGAAFAYAEASGIRVSKDVKTILTFLGVDEGGLLSSINKHLTNLTGYATPAEMIEGVGNKIDSIAGAKIVEFLPEETIGDFTTDWQNAGFSPRQKMKVLKHYFINNDINDTE